MAAYGPTELLMSFEPWANELAIAVKTCTRWEGQRQGGFSRRKRT